MASESSEQNSISPKRIKLDDSTPYTDLKSASLLGPFSLIDHSMDAFAEVPGSSELPSEPFEVPSVSGDKLPSLDIPNPIEEEEDDDDDDVSSTVSNVSDLSGLSEMSGQQWKPMTTTISWIEKQMLKGVSPRNLFSQITGDSTPLPDSVPDMALWRIIVSYLTEPPKRPRLPNINSIDDVVNLLKTCKKIMVLTGAGVSVSCGIPDFRSKDGVYARLAVDFPDLPDPQAMFDISYFRRDPRPFFKFAREIYPGQFKPSPCHRFIKMLEKQKKLLRNYTQNIDTLEKVAGIDNVVECHGSFATASCTTCGHKVSSDDIREAIFKQEIPMCPKCTVDPDSDDKAQCVMKPDIVFFGEGLPETFHDAMAKDKDECDLLIVIGSSLKVRPVALIPCSLPNSVPQILINRERLPHLNFDVELLGDSDVIIDQLCYMLGEGWEENRWRETPLEDVTSLSRLLPQSDTRYDSNYSSSEDDSDNESEIEASSTQGPVKCQRIGRRVPDSVDDNSRHMSLDSSRDSGIGEGSNSGTGGMTDSAGSTDPSPSASPNTAIDSGAAKPEPLSGFPPENSFYRMKKRRYVFPGAEVTHRSCDSLSE